jgi:hypothetical protein
MKRKGLIWGSVLVLVASVAYVGVTYAEQEPSISGAVAPDVVADYIHAVIEADRTLYTTHVVERMHDNGIVIAAEAWDKQRALPLPAQMLLMAGRTVEGKGSGLRFRLASLWPIYEDNGPADEFERTGLQVVAEDPSEPYTGIITRGDLRYFKAIYADKAVSKACVICHNGHILSSKRNLKLGDVMGGIIISFPLPTKKED